MTIPSTPTGANIRAAAPGRGQEPGLHPADYTIMPFDGGFSGGSSQVTALKDFNAQLMSTFGWSSAQAYAHEGFSGMNGRSGHRRDLHPGRLPDRAQLRGEQRDEPVHVLVGQPGP